MSLSSCAAALLLLAGASFSGSAAMETELVSMNTYSSLSDIVDSATIPCDSGTDHGRVAAAKLLSASKPQVVFIQRTCGNLEDFMSALQESPVTPPRFVLLAVNGDPPLTHAMQDQIANLRGLAACYATEMHTNVHPDLIHPLPLGMKYHHAGNYEPVIKQVKAAASFLSVTARRKSDLSVQRAAAVSQTQNASMTFADALAQVRAQATNFDRREAKLLVGPMGISHPARAEYAKTFAKPEFNDLVHIADERLDILGYLTLLSKYKAVLSPPGVSYDCFRTWETLAVGSAPALQRDTVWNMGLYEDAGLRRNFLPPISELTPSSLKSFLEQVPDPASHQDYLTAHYWSRRWKDHLK